MQSGASERELRLRVEGGQNEAEVGSQIAPSWGLCTHSTVKNSRRWGICHSGYSEGNQPLSRRQEQVDLVEKTSLHLDKMPRGIRQLYDQFCLIKDKGRTYGCPKSFNLMTVA